MLVVFWVCWHSHRGEDIRVEVFEIMCAQVYFFV